MIILTIALISYGARVAASETPARPDVLFRWSTVVTTIVLDTVVLLLAALVARGLPWRDAFALRRPRSWRDAGAVALGALAFIYAVSLAEELILGHAGREQSVPQYWDATRVIVLLANAAVISIFVPVVEESLTRGLGFHLLEPYGRRTAVVGTAAAFAVAHGAIVDLPWVLATGLGLGYLRARSDSLYPCLLLHGAVNGIAVFASAVLAA